MLRRWMFQEISWRAELSVVQNARTGHEGAVPQHLLREDYVRKGLAVPSSQVIEKEESDETVRDCA